MKHPNNLGYLQLHRFTLPKRQEDLDKMIPIAEWATKYSYSLEYCRKLQQTKRVTWFKFGRKVYFRDEDLRDR